MVPHNLTVGAGGGDFSGVLTGDGGPTGGAFIPAGGGDKVPGDGGGAGGPPQMQVPDGMTSDSVLATFAGVSGSTSQTVLASKSTDKSALLRTLICRDTSSCISEGTSAWPALVIPRT